MAEVRQRTWTVPGQRTKRRAWGFTVVVNGKRKRYQSAEWSKEDAEAELAKCSSSSSRRRLRRPEASR